VTYLRIDPQELTTTAGTLRNCAAETAEIGSGIAACVSCPLPPDIAPVVGQIASLADRIAEVLVGRFLGDVQDLVNRASIASGDVATVAASPVTAHAVSDSILGGPMIIGGQPPVEITIIDPTTGREYVPPGSMTIGGSRPLDPLSQVIADRQARFEQRRDAILSNPSTTEAQRIQVMEINLRNSEQTGRLLAPSQSDIERKLGYPITSGQYLQMVPNGIPRW
jgi:hypothetical protein